MSHPETIYYVTSHSDCKGPDFFCIGIETDDNGVTYKTEVLYRPYAPNERYPNARLSDYRDQEYNYQLQRVRTGSTS